MLKRNKVLIALTTVILISGCEEESEAEFIFYQGHTPISVKDYDIYTNELHNVYLVVKDYNRRNYLINNKIDSLHYKFNNQIYRADLNKISGKFSKFHLITQNDGKRLFINGFNEYKQEMLYLGVANDLKFITDNNPVITLKMNFERY